MGKLAAFITSGYIPAIVTTVVFAWSTLLLPVGGVLSSSSISLFGLRFGVRRAVWVMVVSLVSIIFLAIIMSALNIAAINPWEMALLFGGILWLPTLLATSLLRRTNSFSFLFQALTIASLVLLLMVALVFPDRAIFWKDILHWVTEGNIEVLLQQRPEIADTYNQLVTHATGFIVSSLLLVWIPALLLAYWWGAFLMSPGGFKKTFLTLQLGKSVTAVAILSIVLTRLLDASISFDLFIAFMTIYLFQGIATVHYVLAKKDMSFLLFLFYGMLVLSPFLILPVLAVAAFGCLENFVNIRKRMVANI